MPSPSTAMLARTRPVARCLRLKHVCARQASTKTPVESPLLQHQHVSRSGLIAYSDANAIQSAFQHDFLQWKDQTKHEASRSTVEPPRPKLVSFECKPTFTIGRRQDASILEEQQAILTQPLQIELSNRREPIQHTFMPQICKTQRGGLTTYHGPGQLVLWPVLDMHSPLYPNFTVKSYAGHLEATTQRVLHDLFGITTYIDGAEPGVWIAGSNGREDRKIAALGVHQRRYVTSLGLALNVDIAVTGETNVNPWKRFVPCGIEGKGVTSVAAEADDRHKPATWDLEDLSKQWAQVFENGLVDPSLRTFTHGR